MTNETRTIGYFRMDSLTELAQPDDNDLTILNATIDDVNFIFIRHFLLRDYRRYTKKNKDLTFVLAVS